jgi:hypothetical protein
MDVSNFSTEFTGMTPHYSPAMVPNVTDRVFRVKLFLIIIYIVWVSLMLRTHFWLGPIIAYRREDGCETR